MRIEFNSLVAWPVCISLNNADQLLLSRLSYSF